jgi:hypothetical protein
MSFYLFTFCFMSFYLMSFGFMRYHFVSFCFMSFYLVSFCFVAFYIVSFRFKSVYLMPFCFMSFHLMYFCFMSYCWVSFCRFKMPSIITFVSFCLVSFCLSCSHCSLSFSSVPSDVLSFCGFMIFFLLCGHSVYCNCWVTFYWMLWCLKDRWHPTSKFWWLYEKTF